MNTQILFTPLTLKNLTLPGRIVRSSTEFFCSGPEAHIEPCEVQVYKQLGEQPLGLILTAHTCVSPEGRSNPWQNAIWDDSYIPDVCSIAREAQAHGVPAVMQIGHGGMKADGNNGGLPVYTPDTMTVGEIRGVIDAFGDAALRVKNAGMSGVMIHGAHMYLLSQFFYPAYNHRTDCYGGSALNRFRIIYEILETIKKRCGDAYPVFLKVNVTDASCSEAYYADVVSALNRAGDGFDAVEISGWNSSPRGVHERPFFIDYVRRLHSDVSVPLIEVGGFRTADTMTEAIEAGASAISVSRPLLCEPDFVSRIKAGEPVRSKCKGCGFCVTPLDMNTMIRCPIAGTLKQDHLHKFF